MFSNHVYLIDKSKQDLSLNNLQWLIWYKTKQTCEELFLTFELRTYVKLNRLKSNCCNQKLYLCNIIAEGFRFIYLAFRFSSAENLSLSAWVS